MILDRITGWTGYFRELKKNDIEVNPVNLVNPVKEEFFRQNNRINEIYARNIEYKNIYPVNPVNLVKKWFWKG